MNLAQQGTYLERCKSYLPSYNVVNVRRDITSRDGVIVLPLFQAWSGVIPEYHINSAFWVYHSFLVNSNVIDRHIPIIFYVDRLCWSYKSVREMFHYANIPDDIIWFFDPIPADSTRYYLGLKMSPLWDDRFNKFDNVLIWDADLFVAVPPGAQSLDVDWLFLRDKLTQPAALHVNPDARKPFRMFESHRLSGEDAKTKQSEIMFDLCGEVYEDGGYSIGGCVHSFCPSEIKESYKEFYRRALPVMRDDEMIVSLWSIHMGEEVECLDAWFPPMAYEVDHMDGFIERKESFLCHLWVDSIGSFNHVSRWRDVIGVDKRNNILSSVSFDNKSLSRTHRDPLLPFDMPVDLSIQPVVAYLNLDRRGDRRGLFESAIRSSGYRQVLKRFSGLDQSDFDSYGVLIDFVCQKYPNFDVLKDTERSWVAHQYSYMECLFWISCQDNYVLLFEDDMMLKEDWDTTVQRINLLPSDLDIVMFNYCHIPSLQRNLDYYGNGWEVGIKSNGTTCTLFSPSGAQLLYDILVENPFYSCESRIDMLSNSGRCFSASPVLAKTLIFDSDMTSSHMSKKKLVTFDGFAGAGKSTQIDLLPMSYECEEWYYTFLIEHEKCAGLMVEYFQKKVQEKERLPTISFYIDVPYALGQERRAARENGVMVREPFWSVMDEGVLQKLEIMKAINPNFHVIDGLQAVDTIHKEILTILDRSA